MNRKYKVGGYVKLAKLWERSKDAAVAYHSSYYAEKFRDDADKRLVGVYIDITGNKEIYTPGNGASAQRLQKWFRKSDFLADKGLYCSKYL